MSYPPKAVANEFLQLAKAVRMPISPMKLQKLVYFAHGWLIGLKDRDLIDEPVEAWKFGPVIRSLYREFADCGNRPISQLSSDVVIRERGVVDCVTPSLDDQPTEAKMARSLTQRIWDVYGQFTAIQLSNLTHQEGTPWHRVYTENAGVLPDRIKIPREYLHDYFANMASKERV